MSETICHCLLSPRAGLLWQSVWIFTWYEGRSAQVECKLSLMSLGGQIDRRTWDLGANGKARGHYWRCIYCRRCCLRNVKNKIECFTVHFACMHSCFGTMLTMLQKCYNLKDLSLSQSLLISFPPEKARRCLYVKQVTGHHVLTCFSWLRCFQLTENTTWTYHTR